MTLFQKAGYFFILVFGLSSLSSCKKELILANVSDTDTTTKIVVILGSSSAAGYGASVQDSAWVNRLSSKFVADGKKSKVINLGVPGFTTYHVLPTGTITPFQRPNPNTKKNITVALSYHPGLVIMNLPTNDIALNYTDDEITANYATLTNMLDSANIAYIITGTHPRNFSDAPRRTRLKTFNDKMTEIYGNAICNYYDQLSDIEGYILKQYAYGDGIHVNDGGHKIIYSALLNHSYLKAYLKY